MSREHSADPFSTFLKATTHQIPSGHAQSGARSTEPLPPVATVVLHALRGRTRALVGELRVELGLTTLRIAEAVAVLQRLQLVEVVPAGSDEAVEITAAGAELIDGTA